MHMKMITTQGHLGQALRAGCAAALLLSAASCKRETAPAAAPGVQTYRIAFASFGPDPAADNAIEGYLAGLRDEGIQEGKNLEVIRKHGSGEIGQLPLLMQSLEAQSLDLIVPMSTPGLSAAFGAVKTTPMVFVYTYDPLGAGAGKSFADHLPRVTGVASFPPVEGTMELILQLFPQARTVGTIYNASEANSVKAVGVAREVLKAKGLTLTEISIGGTGEVLQGTQALLARGPDVVWVTGDNTILQALEGGDPAGDRGQAAADLERSGVRRPRRPGRRGYRLACQRPGGREDGGTRPARREPCRYPDRQPGQTPPRAESRGGAEAGRGFPGRVAAGSRGSHAVSAARRGVGWRPAAGGPLRLRGGSDDRPSSTRQVSVGMHIGAVRSDGASVVRVSGRLDAAHAQAFAEALLPVLADLSAAPVLDLSGVEYISSGGLRVLLQAAKQAQARGAQLTLTQVPAAVYSVLALSGFCTFMAIRAQD